MFRLVIVDDVVESVFHSDKLNSLITIAEGKGITFTLQSYSKNLLGFKEDLQYSAIIAEDMSEKTAKLIGVMHYDNTCHIAKLQNMKEVLKWEVNGRILYTDSDHNTISKFSRIESKKLDLSEHKFIEYMSGMDYSMENLEDVN